MRGDAVHCRFLPLLEDLSEVWAYLHLPALGRGDLTRPGLVPIARRWDSRRDSRNLGDQLERLQEAIDSYPYLDVVWQPYLGEGDEGQPWLVQARPYFGRPGRSFRGLHDTTDWRERTKEQIDNWERRGKAVDVAGEVATLRALLYSAVQDREAAQRQTAELRRELERVRSTGAGGFWRNVQRFIGTERKGCGRAAKVLRWDGRRRQVTQAQGADNRVGMKGNRGPLTQIAQNDHVGR
ncbi:hypothetical protein Taro_030827 [Colocasia esculenta]|uniref:Uncharacterized protein n=1 Tax=Colocasia esculenta TaxID=4460 RepID=A0A843VNE4_COLES|nr:hypothetical protein [Colocasia esculenta]